MAKDLRANHMLVLIVFLTVPWTAFGVIDNTDNTAALIIDKIQELEALIGNDLSFDPAHLGTGRIAGIVGLVFESHLKVSGITPSEYFKVFTRFGYLMSRLSGDPYQLHFEKISSQIADVITHSIASKRDEFMKRFSNTSEQLDDIDRRYSIAVDFNTLWHAYATFWTKMDKASKQYLIDECEQGSTERTLMGIKSYLQDSKNGFMTHLLEMRYKSETYTNVRDLILSLLSQSIHIKAFCAGLEGKYVSENGVIKMYAEDRLEITRRLVDIENSTKRNYWKEPQGLQKFVCDSLSEIPSNSTLARTEHVTGELQSTFGNYGKNFAVVMGRFSEGGPSQHGFVEERQLKSIVIDLDHQGNSSDHYSSLGNCSGITNGLDVVVFRDGQASTAHTDKLTQYFKRIEEEINREFVDEAIGWSLANAIDNVRLPAHGAPALDPPLCKFHYIVRGKRESLEFFASASFKLSHLQHELVVKGGTAEKPDKKHFQVLSIC